MDGEDSSANTEGGGRHVALLRQCYEKGQSNLNKWNTATVVRERISDRRRSIAFMLPVGECILDLSANCVLVFYNRDQNKYRVSQENLSTIWKVITLLKVKALKKLRVDMKAQEHGKFLTYRRCVLRHALAWFLAFYSRMCFTWILAIVNPLSSRIDLFVL